MKFSHVMFQRTVRPPPHQTPTPTPSTDLPCLKPTRSVLCYNWGSSKTAAASSPTRTPSSNTLPGLLSCAVIGPLPPRTNTQTSAEAAKEPRFVFTAELAELIFIVFDFFFCSPDDQSVAIIDKKHQVANPSVNEFFYTGNSNRRL